MSYTDVIKVGPDVLKELQRLKKQYGLQSHNKVLKRLLNLTKDGRENGGKDASS